MAPRRNDLSDRRGGAGSASFHPPAVAGEASARPITLENEFSAPVSNKFLDRISSRFSNGFEFFKECDAAVDGSLLQKIETGGWIRLKLTNFQDGSIEDQAGETIPSAAGINLLDGDARKLAERILAGDLLDIEITVCNKPGNPFTGSSEGVAYVLNHEVSLHVEYVVEMFEQARALKSVDEIKALIIASREEGGLLNGNSHHARLFQKATPDADAAGDPRMLARHRKMVRNSNDGARERLIEYHAMDLAGNRQHDPSAGASATN